MDEIRKQSECEWETRLCDDVKHSQTQKSICERHKITMYQETRYNYVKMIVYLKHGIKNGLYVAFDCYVDYSNTPPHNNIEPDWIFYDDCAYPLHHYLQGFFHGGCMAQIRDMLLKYRKTYVDNVLLKICITTLLDYYANTYFHDLQLSERILADDYLVKTILSKI